MQNVRKILKTITAIENGIFYSLLEEGKYQDEATQRRFKELEKRINRMKKIIFSKIDVWIQSANSGNFQNFWEMKF